MIELQITPLNSDNRFVSLDRQMQKSVKGGFNQEIYDLITSGDRQITYGITPSGAFEYNIIIDNGENNLINQGAT